MRLRFNPEAFPAGARVELRGRASQSGQLTCICRPWVITQPTTQALGPLQFEKAPCHDHRFDLQHALSQLLGDAQLRACPLPERAAALAA